MPGDADARQQQQGQLVGCGDGRHRQRAGPARRCAHRGHHARFDTAAPCTRLLAPVATRRGLAGRGRRLPAGRRPGRSPIAAPMHLQPVAQHRSDGRLRTQRCAPAGHTAAMPTAAAISANRCSCVSCRCCCRAPGKAGTMAEAPSRTPCGRHRCRHRRPGERLAAGPPGCAGDADRQRRRPRRQDAPAARGRRGAWMPAPRSSRCAGCFEQILEQAGHSMADLPPLTPLPVLARHAWREHHKTLDLFADARRSADAIGDFCRAGRSAPLRQVSVPRRARSTARWKAPTCAPASPACWA